jgi:hypothetical protein
MREIGNKTHGDLAEIAIAKFIQAYIPNYECKHVGKALFRAKDEEEDILVILPNKSELKISLKAYGDGPLQLSTNKDSSMFSYLTDQIGKTELTDKEKIRNIINNEIFQSFYKVNVLPLIYNEREYKCKIVVFEVEKAFNEVCKIEYISQGNGRKHPIYKFLNKDNGYIFEVRYGDVSANALQRGLWTHTKNADLYFRNLTNGWINYSVNYNLLEILAALLVSENYIFKNLMEDHNLKQLLSKKLLDHI